MNIALLTAGGVGARMHQDIPKQFLTVNEKPVIVYTLEAFQAHSNIDEIAVVCVEGWEGILEAYARQFNISKLKKIIPGGRNGMESIMNGIFELEKDHSADDIVLIHDSIRPMVSADIISDCIVTTQRYGCAITVIPCAEVMLTTDDAVVSNGQVNRDNLKRTQTPQGIFLGKACELYRKAVSVGNTESIAMCATMVESGEQVHFCHGSERNIKLTTVEDIDIFKALLIAQRAEWLK